MGHQPVYIYVCLSLFLPVTIAPPPALRLSASLKKGVSAFVNTHLACSFSDQWWLTDPFRPLRNGSSAACAVLMRIIAADLHRSSPCMHWQRSEETGQTCVSEQVARKYANNSFSTTMLLRRASQTANSLCLERDRIQKQKRVLFCSAKNVKMMLNWLSKQELWLLAVN